ncbi:hypothetical protein J7T55_007680 [Diaporthe amygdali]|uniref:uncharacterized protein n=1 Tax=Phomopsis amygdali TaxID=1214568 RepID=UPI0022FE7626|nr:uncharacterized protein J7T55_007680 [Diaporthe amygdali]KAJ0107491.1 hypothetical protein J7T55_007680 [Diaporthe amygdali]
MLSTLNAQSSPASVFSSGLESSVDAILSSASKVLNTSTFRSTEHPSGSNSAIIASSFESTFTTQPSLPFIVARHSGLQLDHSWLIGGGPFRIKSAHQPSLRFTVTGFCRPQFSNTQSSNIQFNKIQSSNNQPSNNQPSNNQSSNIQSSNTQLNDTKSSNA